MDASSEAMPEPTRPAIMRAASTGPSSRTTEVLIRREMYCTAPYGSSWMAPCRARTMPVNVPVRMTMKREPTPI